jgi:hypothetical protein
MGGAHFMRTGVFAQYRAQAWKRAVSARLGARAREKRALRPPVRDIRTHRYRGAQGAKPPFACREEPESGWRSVLAAGMNLPCTSGFKKTIFGAKRPFAQCARGGDDVILAKRAAKSGRGSQDHTPLFFFADFASAAPAGILNFAAKTILTRKA